MRKPGQNLPLRGSLDTRSPLAEAAAVHRDVRSLLFAALLAAMLWCTWLVLRPFVTGMIWAAVLVVTFKPLHTRLSGRLRGRTWAASTLVILAVAAFIVVPIVVAAAQVVQ